MQCVVFIKVALYCEEVVLVCAAPGPKLGQIVCVVFQNIVSDYIVIEPSCLIPLCLFVLVVWYAFLD